MSKITNILGLILLSACGTGTQKSSLAQDSDEGVDQLVGHYAMLMNFASSQKLPLVGQVNTLGRLYKIASIERDGEGLKITEKSCRLTVDGGIKLKLTFSDASIQATPTMEGRLMATQDRPGGAIRFTRESLTQVIGAKLTDPRLDPLPEREDDSRVFDMDGDGKPGATANARAFVLNSSLNYVMRSTNQYEGTVEGSGLMRGLVKDKTEGVILDVSNLLMRPAIGKFEFIPDADPSKSQVTLLKIAEDMDCSTVDWAFFDTIVES